MMRASRFVSCCLVLWFASSCASAPPKPAPVTPVPPSNTTAATERAPSKLTEAPPAEEVLLALGCEAGQVSGNVCRQCPAVTGYREGGEWSISEMRVGRFMPGERGSLLAVQFEGCHDMGGEGALLRQDGPGEWSVVAKSPSYALGQCVTLLDKQKVEQIICPREVMGQGYMQGALVHRVPSAGGAFEERVLMEYGANSAACPTDEIMDQSIKVDSMNDIDGDGDQDLTVRLMELRAPIPEGYADACEAMEAKATLPDPSSTPRLFYQEDGVFKAH